MHIRAQFVDKVWVQPEYIFVNKVLPPVLDEEEKIMSHLHWGRSQKLLCTYVLLVWDWRIDGRLVAYQNGSQNKVWGCGMVSTSSE
jgi:hypothetical protein